MPVASSSATAKAASRARRYFFRIVDELRIALPPNRPVVVQADRQLGHKEGDCCVIGRRFRIRVSRELNLSQRIDVLIHEWAHALSWDAAVGKVAKSRRISDSEFDWLAHGPKWGIAYSKVYQCFNHEIEPRFWAEELNAAMLASGRSRR
jgi:hypothetical protein